MVLCPSPSVPQSFLLIPVLSVFDMDCSQVSKSAYITILPARLLKYPLTQTIRSDMKTALALTLSKVCMRNAKNTTMSSRFPDSKLVSPPASKLQGDG